jgi:DNA (cytosine-5)-methyltransferase 1
VSAAPLVLDLFCGEGGASRGYADAGFEVVGVDNDPKALKRYPFPSFCNDWMMGLLYWLARRCIDIIHASPPCQLFSSQSWDRAKAEARWANLIPPVREALEATGKPFVIENVPGAKRELNDPVKLNGFMFPGKLCADWTPPNRDAEVERDSHIDSDGRQHWNKCPCTGNGAYDHYPVQEVAEHWTIKRDRLFEVSGFKVEPPEESKPKGREVMSITVSGNPTMVWNKVNRQGVPLEVRQKVMGGLNWMSCHGVGESIPPAYTEHIGKEFIASQI